MSSTKVELKIDNLLFSRLAHELLFIIWKIVIIDWKFLLIIYYNLSFISPFPANSSVAAASQPSTLSANPSMRATTVGSTLEPPLPPPPTALLVSIPVGYGTLWMSFSGSWHPLNVFQWAMAPSECISVGHMASSTCLSVGHGTLWMSFSGSWHPLNVFQWVMASSECLSVGHGTLWMYFSGPWHPRHVFQWAMAPSE